MRDMEASTRKAGAWSRFTAWLNASGGPGLTIAFFSALAAALSAFVALVQMVLLVNERSTPYRAPVHSAQVEAAKEVSAAAADFWEALSAGMQGCRGYQSGDPTWDFDKSVAPRFEAEAQAFSDFRKAMFGAAVVMSEPVLTSANKLRDVVLRAGSVYGSRTCEESVKLEAGFATDTAAFSDAYFAFVNAARTDASIDKLSVRPDLTMPQ